MYVVYEQHVASSNFSLQQVKRAARWHAVAACCVSVHLFACLPGSALHGMQQCCVLLHSDAQSIWCVWNSLRLISVWCALRLRLSCLYVCPHASCSAVTVLTCGSGTHFASGTPAERCRLPTQLAGWVHHSRKLRHVWTSFNWMLHVAVGLLLACARGETCSAVAAKQLFQCIMMLTPASTSTVMPHGLPMQ